MAAVGGGMFGIVMTLVFEEELLEPQTIVKLTRRFQFIVRNGITRYDEEKIF